MYGFSPAAFVMRRAYDHMGYETVEGPWLAAWFEHYVRKVEEEDAIFAITQQGIATGQLMMSEETAERYAPTKWRRYRGSFIHEFKRSVDTDMLQQITDRIAKEVIEGTAIPTRFLFKDTQSRSSLIELRQHQKMIELFPEKGLRADRLRAMGIKI